MTQRISKLASEAIAFNRRETGLGQLIVRTGKKKKKKKKKEKKRKRKRKKEINKSKQQ